MEEIKEELKQAIKNLYNLDFDPELTPSPENIDADYSTNAPLKLAKELHKSPMVIADELLKAFVSRTRATVSSPGFLNFGLDDNSLHEAINNLCNDFDAQISSSEYVGKTVICEFSDPNPFKVLHVGHLYTSIVGDSIARLYEYAGARVIRANFGGDVGLHVAKTMYALLQKDTTDLKIEDIANCYIEGTALYDEDAHAHEEITKLNKEIYRINTEGIHGRVTDFLGDPQNVLRSKNFGGRKSGRTRPENSLAALYWRGRELSYEYFNDFYATIGVKFDKYYPESTVAALGLKKVKEELEKGVYEMSGGAVIFDGQKFGLHTRVFINKEGVPTYEAKDVGLIFTKWQDWHFDKSIVITGSEQLDYMKVVLKSVEQYAPELVERTTHLTHGLVKLPGGVKMSSRKGNFLKAVDVLDMVKDELKNEYNSTDEKVSLAATKYAFLKYKMGGNIIFDPKESVKMTGNSGPYLLYSCVRAKKILAGVAEMSLRRASGARQREDERARPVATEQRSEREPSLLGSPSKAVPSRNETGASDAARGEIVSDRTPAEKNLIKKLLEYKVTLKEATAEMAPHKLANYLYELAQTFSRFYESCPVVGCENEPARAKLVKVYLDVMTHGLGILGINIPEEM